MNDIQIGYLIVFGLYGGVLMYGFITGDMLAGWFVAKRNEEPFNFWLWACINAGITVLALAMLISSLVRV